MIGIVRTGLRAALGVVVFASVDAPMVPRWARAPLASASTPRGQSACEGAREALPDALFYKLRSGAFPGSSNPDVAVHVPPGFDATRRPGLVVYFHGWQGCVAAALASEDLPCDEDGGVRPSADLASIVDAADINALAVAVEVRADTATGEPGRMAMPAGLRDLLRELFVEHLAEPIGCSLAVDALDRIVVVAHSGGYQAAAGALELGDLPRVAEVVLLDALYGADDVFLRWIQSEVGRFDPRVTDDLRFVDLYTCCAGTAARSRLLAQSTRRVLDGAGLEAALYDHDGEEELDPGMLARPVVFKRVPRAHSDLPRAYLSDLLKAAGFAHIDPYRSHLLRPN
jgi:hypothetical protein